MPPHSPSAPTEPAPRSQAQPALADQRLWKIEISPAAGYPDRPAERLLAQLRELGLPAPKKMRTARGFLVQGPWTQSQAEQLGTRVLSDCVVEQVQVRLGAEPPATAEPETTVVYVLPKPGVTDPEAETAQATIRLEGQPVSAVRTFRKYEFQGFPAAALQVARTRLLANESIEQVIVGELEMQELHVGQSYLFRLVHIPLRQLDGPQLEQLSRDWQLSLTRVEMETIQAHYRQLDREPTDIELETIAQTWSEHCSHKTLKGRVLYEDEHGKREFSNLLKETIFGATQEIRARLGSDDWCVSVFRDNAGVIRFNDQYNVTFKVETHNRPSAIEPYGGANTGLGGVIRDTLGTGMGAKPVCSTDVFCFAPPETAESDLPPGVIHPRRLMKGVVSGVRDYGNRMGIPTVNGAVWFDPRYVGNPMVFCGNVGLLPHDQSFKQTQPNDLIVAIGGRTGRDGIHGATFSSAELTDASERTSSGAVQIGNAITEKMLADVLIAARDRGLYNAVTDCGAGGFSSAVGEMGEEIGAEVWLEQAPLKYAGLSYTEVWISEAQERMVFAVPAGKWDEFRQLCEAESVEATVLGKFTPTGKLTLKFEQEVVGELEMSFLHDGRPPVVRQAKYQPRPPQAVALNELARLDPAQTLRQILAAPSVASKHWIIRQYDHEVQAGSVIKPLVGVDNDGPADAAVVRPLIRSDRAIAVGCGMNPLYGDLDPYHMAASSIDEALRNVVAVGGDPDHTGILDNFCWGYTDRPETLGSLVRAALACRDLSLAWGTPFISGKDSLNNEFSYTDTSGRRQTISIPSTLLISAMAIVPDANRCVTMDWKEPGNFLYIVGRTGEHLGGSHALLVHGDHRRGLPPTVDAKEALRLFRAVHTAIQHGLVRSCHDLSEGGLAVALAEMAFAGGLGGKFDLQALPLDSQTSPTGDFSRLFAESKSRFLCEVAPANAAAFEALFPAGSVARAGAIESHDRLVITNGQHPVIDENIQELKRIWQGPLDWS
ncbi:MAG: phosphoribosylformylglycinamidine synthase subunit PurL [Planctomycetota bacterium]